MQKKRISYGSRSSFIDSEAPTDAAERKELEEGTTIGVEYLTRWNQKIIKAFHTRLGDSG